MKYIRLSQEGVAPNTISYNILMDACVKAGSADAAEDWLAQMLAVGVEANEVSYATLIHARAKLGEKARAEEWLWRMIASGTEPAIPEVTHMLTDPRPCLPDNAQSDQVCDVCKSPLFTAMAFLCAAFLTV